MPVNFFHLTSHATDAADEAALHEAPSPVRPSTAFERSRPAQAVAARPSTAPSKTAQLLKAPARPKTAREKRRFDDSVPHIPFAPTHQGARPARRPSWAPAPVYHVTDEDARRNREKETCRRRGRSVHTVFALGVRSMLLMRKVQAARDRRRYAFECDLAQRCIATSWRRDNPAKRRRKRCEYIVKGPALAKFGKLVVPVLHTRCADRIVWFLRQAHGIPPFKLVMVRFLYRVRNCQRIWRHKLRPRFALLDVLARAWARAEHRYRSDLTYFANLVRAGRVDFAEVREEEEAARVPPVIQRDRPVQEEVIVHSPKKSMADKRRLLLEVPDSLEAEVDGVEGRVRAIMQGDIQLNRRHKTKALRRLNEKLSELLQERDDYLSGKKLRQFEASLVCKHAPKMPRKPGVDWTPSAKQYCKERRSKLARINRSIDELKGDAVKEELKRAALAEAERDAEAGAKGIASGAARKKILRRFVARRKLAHERDHEKMGSAAMLDFDENDALNMIKAPEHVDHHEPWSLKVLFATTDFRLPVPRLVVFSSTLDAEMRALLRRSVVEKHVIGKAAKRFARARCVPYLRLWRAHALHGRPDLQSWDTKRKTVSDLKDLQFRVRKEKTARMTKLRAAITLRGLTLGRGVEALVERAKTPG